MEEGVEEPGILLLSENIGSEVFNEVVSLAGFRIKRGFIFFQLLHGLLVRRKPFAFAHWNPSVEFLDLNLVVRVHVLQKGSKIG